MIREQKQRWTPVVWTMDIRLASTWIVVVTAGLFLVIAAYEVLTSGLTAMLFQLVYLPILLAAAVFGLRGGIVVGLLVAVAAVSLRLLGPGEESGLWWAWSSLYLLFGVTVGALFQNMESRVRRATRRADKLSEMYTRTLSSLAHTVEVRDRHTQGHSERVARNAVVMGRELGFGKEHLQRLYWSALLHDLGKIAIPDYILLKDGPLSKREFEEVKRHPAYGADLLASLSSEFRQMAEVVRSHHERWDGLGYPQGIEGAAIPLMSRVISIIDVFEALTSERPYRKPMSSEDALEFVLEAAGRQFDPTLVEIFERCLERGEILAASQQPPSAEHERSSLRLFVTQVTN